MSKQKSFIDIDKVESILLEDAEEKKESEEFKYTDEEKKYLKNLQKRLEFARDQREQAHQEFDDLTYSQQHELNEIFANTRIRAKKNKSDVQFQSGTLRTKMFSFLSTLQGFNLSPDIDAYDENDILLNTLGDSMETILEKVAELDEDEEKMMLRQYELLKQGTVFVEELWDERMDLKKSFSGNYMKFRDNKITSRLKKQRGCATRNIINGKLVYLGDLSKYLISQQPYIFTIDFINYDQAEKIYGGFEMFKPYVKKEYITFTGSIGDAMVENKWRLFPENKNKVEVIRYQDKPNKEFQVILNGVPMLPIGCPFPWEYDEYSLTQQNLKPISADFAYAKSIIFENKNTSLLLDEMMKLALLKTQKSFLPPYINTSEKVISAQVLMPGSISMGVPPNSLIPISDKEIQGVTNSEFAMIQELMRNIDQNTASQTFSGSREQGQNPTATQIIELQKQAQIMLGTFSLATSLLEKKLAKLRLMNLVNKWFDPTDSKLDTIRGVIRDNYRQVAVKGPIEGRGTGIKMVQLSKEMPNPQEIMEAEDIYERNTGIPHQISVINPEILKQVNIIWQINVNPKPKRSSVSSKLMFRNMIGDALALGLSVDPAYLQERFAQVWGEDSSKMFKAQQLPQMPPEQTGQPTGQSISQPVNQPAINIKPQVNVGQENAIV